MYRRKNEQTKKCTDEKMYRRKNARRKKVGRKSADEKLSDEKMSDEILSGHGCAITEAFNQLIKTLQKKFNDCKPLPRE